MSPFTRRCIQVALFTLMLGVLVACVITPLPPTETPPPGPESVADFSDRLTLALIKRDYNQMQSMMGAPFIFSFWLSEGFEATPEDAVEQFSANYLGPAGAVAFDTTTDLTTLLGTDPLAMWGPDVNTVAARYVTGLAADGMTEAILIIAQRDDGTPFWYSALVAPAGFQPPVQPPTPTFTPTFTPIPTPVPETPPERINFAPGTTSATVTGQIKAPGRKEYILNAAAGQVMEVSVSGETVLVDFTITSPDGTQWSSDMLAMGQMLSVKTITLPQNGDYLVTLTTPDGTPATGYDITFVVVTPAASGASPERIRFATGSTQATRSGALSAGGVKKYVLRATVEQIMHVQTGALNVPVNFVITSPSGLMYPGEPLGTEAWVFEQTIRLPESGDYLVTLSTPSDANPTLYDVNFSIEGGTPEPTPVRIQFAAGATSATVEGSTPRFPARNQYLLRALAGQHMTVEIISSDEVPAFSVKGMTDGIVLKAMEDGLYRWSGILPLTQDYLIAVSKPGPSVRYTLVVTVVNPTEGEAPVRIQFAPGATSATVTGNVTPGAMDSYVLRALAGQRMTVALISTGYEANFGITGADDLVPYKRLAIAGRTVTFDLPLTQDYLIDVAVEEGSADYILAVTVVTPGSPAPPERVLFDAGATSATRSGVLAQGSVRQYLLGAIAGQTMAVLTTGYRAPVDFVIQSPTGTTWGAELEGALGYEQFAKTVVLPESGDYLITLSPLPGAATTNYDVRFAIPALRPSVVPERVNFVAGAISAIRQGTITAGINEKAYVLGAAAGQTMEVTAKSTDGPIELLVVQSGGGPIASSGEFAETSRIEVILSVTTDYIVTLSTPAAAVDTAYEVKFMIP